MAIYQQIMIERNRIYQEIEGLQHQLKGLDQYLKNEKINSSNANFSEQELALFSQSEITLSQISHILKTENRFLHHKEICNILSRKTDFSEEEIHTKVSSIIARARKDEANNLINVKYKNSKRYTFWGFDNWLDSNGVVLNEFGYDLTFFRK